MLLDEAADNDLVSASAQQLRGYLRGLNTTRVLGMADWEDLDRRVLQISERSTAQDDAD